jgi:hypothetical protein
MANIKLEEVEHKIITLRDMKVILDSDIANLYGVETKRINEAVSNNPDKFPEGYIVHLTKDEWDFLKSKFSTSKRGGKVKIPNAFTERGLYMLATILKSEKATKTTIAIIDTFAKINELSRSIGHIAKVDSKTEKNKLLKKSGQIIAEILDDNLQTKGTETTIELNFAVLKFKHTIKKEKD